MAAAGSYPLGERIAWTPPPRPDRVWMRGERILVRPLQGAADAEQLYSLSHPPTGDPAIWTYLFEGPFESAGAMRSYLQAAERLDDPLCFTLARLPGEEPQGMASYMRITPEHGAIEIGNIWFGSPLQRTAAATEGIYLLARHAFDELGYRRLEWKCNALNAASRRAADRFGFTYEGTFYKHMVVKGRNRDTAWYAITEERWPAIRTGFEQWLDPQNFDDHGGQRRALRDLITAGAGG